MKKLPKIRVIRPRMAQKRTLIRWLNEWRIEQALQDKDEMLSVDDRCNLATDQKRVPLQYDSEPVRAGQIRLFHPFSKETCVRVRYAVVLMGCDDGSWLVAPFGRFSEPAVPGEWRTRLRVPALRVLCLWNGRSISESILARNWIVGCMSASKLAQALTIHKCLAEGKKTPGRHDNHVGPPLVHPLDPRIGYLDEEREWFASVAVKRAVDTHTIHPWTLSDGGIGALPRAAESRGKYQTKQKVKSRTTRTDSK